MFHMFSGMEDNASMCALRMISVRKLLDERKPSRETVLSQSCHIIDLCILSQTVNFSDISLNI